MSAANYNSNPRLQQTPQSDNSFQIEQLYQQGDVALFKNKDFVKAESFYRKIIEIDPLQIDAYCSLANSIKLKKSFPQDSNGQNIHQSDAVSKQRDSELFDAVYPLYLEALKIDRDDVEANFNMGLLFLQQKQDLNQALVFFQQSLKKDKIVRQHLRNISPSASDNPDAQIQELYRAQFAKAYYNIGMINDRLGEIQKANLYYKKAIEKCEEDPTKQSLSAPYYMRAVTNYAVTLEKLGKREESIQLLNSLKKSFNGEVRIHNNLGIIQKRNGLFSDAEKSFQEAIEIDKNSFFPNYNLGVLKSQTMKPPTTQQLEAKEVKDCIFYFEQALMLASLNKEDVYEINVLVNLAIVYEKIDNLQLAIASLEKALKIDPQNAKIIEKLKQLKLLEQKIKEKQQRDPSPIPQSKPQQQQQQQHQQEGIIGGKQKNDLQQQFDKIKVEKEKKMELFKMQQKEEYLTQLRMVQEMNETELRNLKKDLEKQIYEQRAKAFKEKQNKKMEEFKQQQEGQLKQMLRSLDLEEEKQLEAFVKKRDAVILSEQERRLQEQEAQKLKHISTIQSQKEESKIKIASPEISIDQMNTIHSQQIHNQQVTAKEVKQMESSSQNEINRANSRGSGMIKNNSEVKGGGQKIAKDINIVGLQAQIEEACLPQMQQIQIVQEQELLEKLEANRGSQIDEYGDLKEYKSTIESQLRDNAIENELKQQIQNQKSKPAVQNTSPSRSKSPVNRKDQQTSSSLDGMQFLKWTKQQCNEKLFSDTKNIRSLFRLGAIEMEEQQYQQAFNSFSKVSQIDKAFMPVHIQMKLGECCYKLDQAEKALGFFFKAEEILKPNKDYLILLFIGKCFEKMMQFQKAIDCYQRTLLLYFDGQIEQQQDNALIGNIQFRLGWCIIRSKTNVDKGIEHLQMAQKYLPKNFEIMIKLANVLFKEKGEVEEPMYYIDQCQLIAPNDPESYMLQGKIFQSKDKIDLAISSFEKAIKLYADQKQDAPPKAIAFFYLGNCYEHNKEFKKAILNYKKCLTLDNKHFGACIHLANLLANIGEGQRGAKYFKHAIKIDPESLNAKFGLGKALQQFSENKDAPIEHFKSVIQKDPNHFKAYTQLGILYLDKEDYQQSVDNLKKALSINRQFPLALVSMGNLLFETGHADEAIKYHKQALQINENELQALIGLGNAYYDSNHPKESIQYYKKALQLDDQLSDVHYNLGNALYLVEKIEDAITHYKAAIALNPKKAESYYNLGNALCVKSEYQNAIQSYLQALEIDPKNAPALYNLGNAYYMTNRFEDAIKVYLKALDINETSAECHFNLASAFNDVGNFSKALYHYQRSVELDDSNVDAFLCLGGVLETMKQIPLAEKQYKIALEKDPDNQRAKESLAKIQKLMKKL